MLFTTTELIFYALFHLYLKPRADDLSKRSIKRFRDYDQSSMPNRRRHLPFKRILDRIEERSVIYLLIVIDVHDSIFDPGARSTRRLEELRQVS